ncbi:MAG: hypothetical protein WAO57_09655 [Syntrophomonadaceae bacterium]|mgnify:FL=1
MKHLKRPMGYLLYVAAFGCLVITMDRLGRYYDQITATTYQVSLIWVVVSQIGVPVLVGGMLALPQLIRMYQQPGSWQVDHVKLLTVGLPALGVALASCAWMVPSDWLNRISYYLLTHCPTLLKAGGLLLGFVLLTSFYKENNCRDKTGSLLN